MSWTIEFRVGLGLRQPTKLGLAIFSEASTNASRLIDECVIANALGETRPWPVTLRIPRDARSIAPPRPIAAARLGMAFARRARATHQRISPKMGSLSMGWNTLLLPGSMSDSACYRQPRIISGLLVIRGRAELFWRESTPSFRSHAPGRVGIGIGVLRICYSPDVYSFAWRTQVRMRRLLQMLAFVLAIEGSVTALAQGCSDITKMGIFDVRHTRTQDDMVNDVIHWLSVNEFSTEQDARQAGLKVGIVIPGINLPLNADGTYGDSHSKSWSRATEEYLRQHVETHNSFEQTFLTSNPNIVSAWRDCVLNQKGLICWAKQTDNPKEILLGLELRPLTTFSGLFVKVTDIQYSGNVESKAKNLDQYIGVGSPSPYLFSRKAGSDYATAVNFVVNTNNRDYKCVANAPGLPLPVPAPPPRVPHHNNPKISFLVAFDDKLGAEKYGNGEWTRKQGIETIRADFSPAFPDIRFKYTCHMEGKGDQPAYESGQTCGEQGVRLHLEGFSIELAGASAPFYDVSYKCLSAGEGTPREGTNGTYCGTKGENKQLQKAMVTVVAKDQYKEPD